MIVSISTAEFLAMRESATSGSGRRATGSSAMGRRERSTTSCGQLVARKEELLRLVRRRGDPGGAAFAGAPQAERIPPLFPAGHNGDVFCYRALASISKRRSLYGVEPKGLDGSPPAETVEEMARYEVEQRRPFQPEGPLLRRRLLRRRQHRVRIREAVGARRGRGGPAGRVARWEPLPDGRIAAVGRRPSCGACATWRDGTPPGSPQGRWPTGVRYVHRAPAGSERRRPPSVAVRHLAKRRRIEDATIEVVKRYEPGFVRRDESNAFLPNAAWRHAGEGSEKWKQVASLVVEHVGPDEADGDNMLKEPHVQALAALLNPVLENDSGERHAID